MSLPKASWIGFIVGIVVGAAFFALSFITAFGICSDTSLAEMLFPFALIVDPSLFDHPLMGFVLALIQYPLYGFVLGIAWTRANLSKSKFVACTLVVLVGHFAAAGVATQRVKTMWEEKLSHIQN